MTLNLSQTINNRMGPGKLTMGSTSGVDSSDPIWLAKPGGNYLYSPATAGNYAFKSLSTITGSTVAVETRIDETGQWQATYALWHLGLGGVARNNANLVFYAYDPAYRQVIHSAPLALSGSGRKQLRVIMTPDGVGSLGVQCWYRVGEDLPDIESDEDWVSVGAVTPIVLTGTSGTWSTGFSAYTYDVVGGTGGPTFVRKGVWRVNGVTVATLDPNADPTLTGWAIQRSATGLKTALVTRPVILPDFVNDFMSPPIHRLDVSADFTWGIMLTGHDHGVAFFQCAWGDRAASGPGVIVFLANRVGQGLDCAPEFLDGLGGGVYWPGAPFLPFGQPGMFFLSHNAATDVMTKVAYTASGRVGSSTQSTAAMAGSAGALAPRIALSPAGVYPLGAEIHVPEVYAPRALSLAEMDAIAARLLAGDYA